MGLFVWGAGVPPCTQEQLVLLASDLQGQHSLSHTCISVFRVVEGRVSKVFQ